VRNSFVDIRIGIVRFVTMLSDLVQRDRERNGLSVDEAARRLGVTPAVYRELEPGSRILTWIERFSSTISG
jgi:hypothetical protein